MDELKELNHNHIIEASNKIYNDAVAKYGVSNKAVLFDNQQTQYFRFNELIKNIDLKRTNLSILEIGCGNCEMYKFLNFLGFRGNYTGFDINDNLINQAKQRFGNINVKNVDILKENISSRFDYVLINGLFNIDMGQNSEWVNLFIKKAFELANEALILNATSTYVNFISESMYYIKPEDIIHYAITELSRRIDFSHNNLPCNFTLTIYKNSEWASI